MSMHWNYLFFWTQSGMHYAPQFLYRQKEADEQHHPMEQPGTFPGMVLRIVGRETCDILHLTEGHCFHFLLSSPKFLHLRDQPILPQQGSHLVIIANKSASK